MTINEIEKLLKRKTEYMSVDLIRSIEQDRMSAINEKDEQNANHLWCLAVIYYIQNGFVTIYHQLKNHRYSEAWQALRETELQLITLEQNFSIGNEENDPYHLYFIRNMLQEYEKLFPYEYFVCREKVIKKETCSICGETIKLRGGCKHIPGKIYMGQLCMHEVTDMTYLEPKAVRDPFDKYEFLPPYQAKDYHYNYGLLDGLLGSIHSPYDYWYVEIEKAKNLAYAKVSRNDKCPCGSGKKFKHCCMNREDLMYFDHYKIKVLNELDEKVDRSLTLL